MLSSFLFYSSSSVVEALIDGLLRLFFTKTTPSVTDATTVHIIAGGLAIGKAKTNKGQTYSGVLFLVIIYN